MNKIEDMNKFIEEHAADAQIGYLHQSRLLHAVNQAANMLLASESADLGTTLGKAMKVMASCVDADRMYVWKNRLIDGKLYYVQEYEWLSGERPSKTTLHKGTGFYYTDSIPGWEVKLSSGQCINGALRNLSETERQRLSPYGIVSILVIPLFLREKFWGFVSFDDCHRERVFSRDEVNILRSGSLLLANAITRDTMEKEREEALRQAVQASKAKGEFLSNMSHEMRTPMNAIIGMTAIGKEAKSMERMAYAFKKIEDASTHLLGVINDILDMSKIEANKLELSLVDFDFEKLFQKVVGVVNFRVEQKRQTLYVTIDKKIPLGLIGDDQRLAQVMTNLLSNAIKFTPEGGTIRLDASLVGTEEDLESIRIDVADTGIGISAEQQARLFRPFEQAESTTTRKFGGTGLGLIISKRIIEMMGGKIWIESEPGKGSTFSFIVRLRRGEQIPRTVLSPGVNWSNVRLLAVDDEHEIRKYFLDIARRFNISCDVAASGEEALRFIEAKGFYDMYFIDWKMPDMDGLELSAKIRRKNQPNSVIALMSVGEMDGVQEEACKKGVNAFLSKPLFPSNIADLINSCLGASASIGNKSENPAMDNFEGYHILLVEDVEINREIVMALLEPSAIEIDCALNGAQALGMFSETPHRYDMIFMDIQMPGMDGYETTRRIRALDIPYAKQIPIVAMTANVFREDVDRALESGMNSHVGKPLNIDEVLASLRHYLTGKSADKAPLIKYGPNSTETWKFGIAWSTDLETGNREIDSQHKQIFRLTSNLAAACANGLATHMVEETLGFLAAYTQKHFAEEEALQTACGFPALEKHRKYHEELSGTIAGLADAYKADGSSEKLMEQVNSIVVRLLVKHIKKEDFKIAEHIRGGAGQRPA